MDLTNLSTIKSLLKKHGLLVKKSFGQNFLLDKNIISKIIEVADVNKDDNILEIGPGPGVLTYELVQNAKEVTSVELDKTVIPVLTEVMSSFSNFILEENNILKYIPKYKDYKVVANIPYNITGQILRYFLETLNNKPKSLTLMVQKEVANKIVEKQGRHNLLSLSCELFSKPQIICYVPKEQFFPSPKIDSAVIHLKLRKKALIKNTDDFFKLIRKAFQMKRKMLKKSIGVTSEFLEKLNINPQARPQELNIDDWKNLLESLN